MNKVTSSNSKLAVTAKVARSNLTLSMPSRSRSVLREQALAPWRFQPSDTAKVLPARDGNRNKDFPGLPAWILKASQRDMEIVTRALVTELNSRPDEVALTRPSNEKNAVPFTSEVVSSSTSSCDPGSPSQNTVEQKASASVEESDSVAAQFETPGIRTEVLSKSCNNRRSTPALNNFICKQRTRRGSRAPITIVTADPPDLQAVVQRLTGFRAGPRPLRRSTARAARLRPYRA